MAVTNDSTTSDLSRPAVPTRTGVTPTKVPGGVEYHRVLAREHRGIVRGVAAIALLVGGMYVFAIVLVQVAAVIELQFGRVTPGRGGTDYTALHHAAGLASIALLTPWAMLIQRWLYGVPAASLHSVLSRFRLDLFGRTLVLVAPLWLIAILIQLGLTGTGPLTEWSPELAIGMLAVTLIVMPLQAAGEEYGVRGLVFRVAGGWARGPRAGLVVGIVVSSLVFTLIHVASDPWLNVWYLTFGVGFAIITWRTGGVEVGVVMHAALNTVTYLFTVALSPDLMSPTLDRSPGTGSASAVLPVMAVTIIVTAVVWLRTRRTGPARTPESVAVPEPETTSAPHP